MNRRAFFILMASLLLLAACVPTPDEAPVLQKDQELMIQKGEALPTDSAIPSVPRRYVYDHAEGALTVQVDAAVTLPDVPLPMARVRSQGFDQDAIKRLLKLLANGETVTAHHIQTVATKEQIAMELEQAMQMLEDKSYERADITEEEWKEYVKDLQEQYKNAPFETDIPKDEETDGTFERQTLNGIECDMLEAHTDHTALQVFSAFEANGFSLLSFTRYDIPYYSMKGAIELFPDSEPSDRLRLTYDGAIEKAQEILNAIGEPMTVTHVYLIGDPMTGNIDGIVQDASHWAYSVQCQRTYRGVTVAAGAPGSSRTDGLYTIDWEQETLTVVIDDDGIASLRWVEPLTLTEPISDSSNLLPFDQITEIAERMLRVIYLPYTDAKQEDGRREIGLYIRQAKLELIRIREQDSAGVKNGVLVPAWVFYGDIIETEYDGGEPDVMYCSYGCGGGSEFRDGDEIVLCINAIDGTVIDPLLGY